MHSMLRGGAKWWNAMYGARCVRRVRCVRCVRYWRGMRERVLPPVGWWHPYLARAVCSVRFEFTILLGHKIYGALLKAIQTRTGPFGAPFKTMARLATRRGPSYPSSVLSFPFLPLLAARLYAPRLSNFLLTYFFFIELPRTRIDPEYERYVHTYEYSYLPTRVNFMKLLVPLRKRSFFQKFQNESKQFYSISEIKPRMVKPPS